MSSNMSSNMVTKMPDYKEFKILKHSNDKSTWYEAKCRYCSSTVCISVNMEILTNYLDVLLQK